MLLELFFICHLTVAFANPYHKYPYVFLLDVGNEELQTNSEQIRVSIPGGSLALRYPAVGEGDSIAHLRVSGIDFGTDLKATIVDGGPGYKYVVIVFMGNPGAAYDAVITVSTLSSENNNEETVPEETKGAKGSYQVVDDSESSDPNDSAENEPKDNKNDEPEPSASNFYDSAENDHVNGKEDITDEEISVRSDDNDHRSKDQLAVQDYSDTGDQQNDEDDSVGEDQNSNAGDNSYQEHEAVEEQVRNEYNKYNAIRRYDNVNVHPQESNDEDNEVDNDYNEKEYDPEYPGELDQMFNDEEVHKERPKYADSNNNNDDDDSPAVPY